MKKINLKTIMIAYAAITAAKKDIRFYNNLNACRPGAYEKDIENAKAECNAAVAEFEKVAEPLTAAIKAAEGRAKVRTITAADICADLLEIEAKYGITQKAMNGIIAGVDHNAQNFPAAYKYRPESTFFRAEYHAGSWRVVDIWRDTTCRAGHKISVKLTPEAQAAIIDKMTEWG